MQLNFVQTDIVALLADLFYHFSVSIKKNARINVQPIFPKKD